MATFIGKIDIFDDSTESRNCYSERLEEYFTANEIANEKLQNDVVVALQKAPTPPPKQPEDQKEEKQWEPRPSRMRLDRLDAHSERLTALAEQKNRLLERLVDALTSNRS
ncbi:hypothetical protein DPMN_166697 [Dreissena polymorpha]|uniref:Uncharacterized protein n=1 Tax=Dreissena polymorpha TaxID=45954 RepID=A0A9D4F311_DREPO|nr:hypothetical protein DPMN_166697 [Dreissena polymorpha]